MQAHCRIRTACTSVRPASCRRRKRADIDPNQAHDLKLRIIPYVRAKTLVTEQKLAVAVAERTFVNRTEQEWIVRLEPGILRSRSSNAVKIDVGMPFSEGKYGFSDYHEWIGVALLGFSIDRTA